MADLSFSAATIADLRLRHSHFLATRLTDERAREDFVRSFDGAYDHVVGQRVCDVIDPHALATGIIALCTQKNVARFGAPIGHDVHRRVLAVLKNDNTKVGAYVPRAARAAIDTIVSQPALIPEALIRRIFDQEAAEEVLRDVLYDALREFNESVNPFFAEWGLPGLLKRFMPIGAGTLLKSLGSVRAEFDKRLDPEIRRFLLGFSRNAKVKIANFVVAHGSDPKFIALRKNIALFIYEETLAEIVSCVTDDVCAETDRAIAAVVLEVAAHEEPRKHLTEALTAFVDEHGDKTIGAWLNSLGITERPDLTPLAELLWPHVRTLLTSPPARAFIEKISDEFFSSLDSERVLGA
ncbi:MAG: hypothetical protein FWD69_07495 [Polyangiaceae bacterium]|nr:hypothetical protein [Polyangiaceae bacterium]